MSRTIVIIHPGALGDVLLAVPAMSRLRVRHPRHQLVLCANEPVARLLHECRVIDDWMPLEGSACVELFSRSASVTNELRDRLGRCDLAAAWLRDEEGTLAAALQHAGVKKVLAESPFSSGLRTRHQSDRFLEVMREPADDPSVRPPLAVPGHLRQLGLTCLEERGVRTDRPLVLVHPGSGSSHKCVKPEVLISVMKQLQEEGLCPVILEGPADQDAVTGLFRQLPARSPILRGLDLCTVAAVLSHMQLFIGHDSGVTHLAALLDLPTVALFGPTDPDRWAPRGRVVTVVRGCSCTCRSWDEVSQCSEKPCLYLSVDAIVSACRMQPGKDASPRNPSRSALSPPTPYATVAS